MPVAPLIAWLLAAGGEMPAVAPGTMEGRPEPSALSPLQARIDAAAPGEVIEVGPGEYRGDLFVDRPVRLVGRGRPLLVGSGEGSVVRVRASGVVLEGFDIDGRGGGDLGRDSSGVHVAAPDVVVRDCRIRGTLFGVYLREANGARIERCVIQGIPGKEAGEKGSGIHVWNTDGFALEGNEVAGARDGFYIQSSSHGSIRGNRASELRYALHYMFSDDNVFEDNVFERSAAAAVLMYSKRIAFRRNQLLHNRGFASVGILFKTCDDSVAEDNLVADNARGIFLEGSNHNVFRRNVVAESDVAVVLFMSALGNVFEDNAFVSNLSPLELEGRRTDTVFRGNYWSDDDVPDLDGDGRSDAPYVPASLFDHLRQNLSAADLLAQSPAAAALAQAERAFPVLQQVQVQDVSPRARPPRLPDVPVPVRSTRKGRPWAAGASAIALVAGAWILASGRRGARG